MSISLVFIKTFFMNPFFQKNFFASNHNTQKKSGLQEERVLLSLVALTVNQLKLPLDVPYIKL